MTSSFDKGVKLAQSTPTIPRIIWYTHKDKTYLPKDFERNNLPSPDEWQWKFYNDSMLLDLLQSEYGEDLVNQIAVDKTLFTNGAHRADLFRLTVLYKYGGFIVDTDDELIHNGKVFEEWISNPKK